jgi:hypothetical protein
MIYRRFNDFIALVKADDWEKAFHGDVEARERISKELDGVDLYYHAGPGFGDDYIGVTLADLICHGIVMRVTLHRDT